MPPISGNASQRKAAQRQILAEKAVKEVIRAAWPPDGGLTRKSVRRGVEQLVGLAEGVLDAQAAQVNAITDEVMAIAQEIEEVESFPPPKRSAFIRSQFYSALQSVLLEHVIE